MPDFYEQFSFTVHFPDAEGVGERVAKVNQDVNGDIVLKTSQQVGKMLLGKEIENKIKDKKVEVWATKETDDGRVARKYEYVFTSVESQPLDFSVDDPTLSQESVVLKGSKLLGVEEMGVESAPHFIT